MKEHIQIAELENVLKRVRWIRTKERVVKLLYLNLNGEEERMIIDMIGHEIAAEKQYCRYMVQNVLKKGMKIKNINPNKFELILDLIYFSSLEGTDIFEDFENMYPEIKTKWNEEHNLNLY